MIRIALCCGEEAAASRVFQQSRQILRSVRIPCEMTVHKDPLSAMQKLAADKNYYDIWILDGADAGCRSLAAQLREVNLTPCILFVDQDLSRRHELLHKRPSALITEEELAEKLPQALEKCCAEQMRSTRGFTVKNRDGLLRIGFDEILFVESRQRLAILHTAGKTVEFYAKLSQVMEQLPGDTFLHCHQSYIVNLAKVSRLDKANRCFILTTGTAVEISKSNYSQALSRYDGYTRK